MHHLLQGRVTLPQTNAAILEPAGLQTWAHRERSLQWGGVLGGGPWTPGGRAVSGEGPPRPPHLLAAQACLTSPRGRAPVARSSRPQDPPYFSKPAPCPEAFGFHEEMARAGRLGDCGRYLPSLLCCPLPRGVQCFCVSVLGVPAWLLAVRGPRVTPTPTTSQGHVCV